MLPQTDIQNQVGTAGDIERKTTRWPPCVGEWSCGDVTGTEHCGMMQHLKAVTNMRVPKKHHKQVWRALHNIAEAQWSGVGG